MNKKGDIHIYMYLMCQGCFHGVLAIKHWPLSFAAEKSQSQVLGSVVLLLLIVLLVLLCTGRRSSPSKTKSLTSLRSKTPERKWRWDIFAMRLSLYERAIMYVPCQRWGEEEVTEQKALGPENFR